MDANLRTVSELAKLGFYEWDAAAERYIDVSEEFAALHGVTRAQMLGDYVEREADIERFVHPDDIERYREQDAYYAANPQEYAIEYRVVAGDGSVLHIRETARPVADETGRVVRWVGVCQDISDLKRALVEAQAADRAKSEFLATMSHELRTPVAGIIGLAALLRGGDLSDNDKALAERIETAGTALTTILNDVLDLSKLQAGVVDIVTVAFELRPMVQDVADLFYPTAADKGVALNVDAAADVPRWFLGDPARIRQVLVNLVGNALKFTERGRVTVAVSHRPAQSDHGDAVLRFEVRDTGTGIPPDRHEDLFHDFTQADMSTARKHEGAGLGLAISRRLVRLMHGDIGVDSAPGAGSTFWFEIPGNPGDAAHADRTGAVAAGAPDPGRAVLVAEDNDMLQMIVTSILKQANHHVTVVGDGRAAFEKVRDGDFDVVLMDIHMPEMNGLDAARAIRRLPAPKASIPIIAVTADAMVERRDEIAAAGMNDCVLKPIQAEALLKAIAAATSAADR
jgi:PAS domain S-box-containing protein